jgi:hypothetical protein
MHVAFERIGAGFRNAVTQREQHETKRDRPPVAAQAASQKHRAHSEARQCDELQSRKQDGQLDVRHPDESADQFVAEPQPHLRLENLAIPREQRRVGTQRDRGDVERLIGHAKPVPTRICRADDGKERDAEHEPGSAGHGNSSAVGP